MTTERRASLTAGVLFVAATVTALAAAAVVPPLSTPAELAAAAGERSRIATATLLYLISAGTGAGIAVAFYPVLRGSAPGLALGAVLARSLEAGLYVVAAVSLLAVTGLAGGRGAGGNEVVAIRDAANLAGVCAFVVGAGLYYVVFYRHRLLPRWLSGWGLAGVVLMAAACLDSLFTGQVITTQTVLIVPIAVQEMVLAVWLLTRGLARVSTSAELETEVVAP
ncbi:MAG: DUF4386 domain-containing protein [Nocardioides sp.]